MHAYIIPGHTQRCSPTLAIREKQISTRTYYYLPSVAATSLKIACPCGAVIAHRAIHSREMKVRVHAKLLVLQAKASSTPPLPLTLAAASWSCSFWHQLLTQFACRSYDKTLAKANLQGGMDYLAYKLQFVIKGKQGQELETGTWRQELKERPWRNTTQVASSGLFSSLTYKPKPTCPGMALPQWASPSKSIAIEKMTCPQMCPQNNPIKGNSSIQSLGLCENHKTMAWTGHKLMLLWAELDLMRSCAHLAKHSSQVEKSSLATGSPAEDVAIHKTVRLLISQLIPSPMEGVAQMRDNMPEAKYCLSSIWGSQMAVLGSFGSFFLDHCRTSVVTWVF